MMTVRKLLRRGAALLCVLTLCCWPVRPQTAAAETVPTYTLSDSDYEFLSRCVFVGDSICSGLKVYKILPADNVCAKGNVAARSIFDYTFPAKGKEYPLTQALSILDPDYVIFSMGMNDVNITNAEKFCQNYENLMDKVQEALPDAKLFAASITPIGSASKFTTNAKIDSYNAALRNHLASLQKGYGYVDIAPGLKNANNALIASYSAGDGIHIGPAAYYAILWQVCRQLADTYGAAVPGDLNGDGALSVSDAVLLHRLVTEDAAANLADPAAGDLNDDGCLDLDDLALLADALSAG